MWVPSAGSSAETRASRRKSTPTAAFGADANREVAEGKPNDQGGSNMRRFRWLGLPAAAALAVTLFALTAGMGSARTTVAPSNTSPPVITGKAMVGELLKTDNGTFSGTAPFTYTYQWRICGTDGGACRDIQGATG